MLILCQIATPGHASYGKHLPQHVINAMIAPKAEASERVKQWLASEGLEQNSAVNYRGDAVIIEASISQIEKLLKAEYKAFGE
jgi:tripeptidyl-peptidase-1